ncbi:MAG TPA: SNF2-related protein [Edaphocola sp.]|nr:SNF2-related protein [Edaphocola sp.]
MALSEILKHIYHNATDEVIRRGKKIFHTGGVQLVENDPITESVIFRVRNDVYYNQYRVKIDNYGHGKKISMRCQCPYNMGSVCKHEAAALFQLNDLAESGFFDNIELSFDQKDTTVRMRQITQHYLKLFSGADIYHKASVLASMQGAVRINEALNDTVRAMVTDRAGKTFPVVIRQNEERYFDTSCSCDEHKHPLCVHKVAVFLQLYEEKGSHYFSTIRDWEAQKNKLLGLYGYSLKDDLSGKFEFAFHEGKLFLRVLDASIKKISLQPQTMAQENSEVESNLRYGVAVEQKGSLFPFTTFQLISGEPDDDETALIHKIKRAAPERYIASSGLDNQDRVLITAIRKLCSSDELIRHIKRNMPFGEFLDDIEKKLKTPRLEDELRHQVWDFYLPRYQSLLQRFSDFPFTYWLPEGQPFSKKNLQPVQFPSEVFSVSLKFKVDNGTGNVIMSRDYCLGGETLPDQEVVPLNAALILFDGKVFAARSLEVINILEQFDGADKKIIDASGWPAFLEEKALPFSKHVPVDFDKSLKRELPPHEPELRLHLKETDKLMILKPVFVYGHLEREWLDNQPVAWAESGILNVQSRDMAAEQTFLNRLRYLHPLMQESRKSAAFLLPSKEALKGNWYFEFMDKMKEENVKIIGYDNLRQLKINPNKPKTKLQIATGIDWFDTEIELTFGDERVSIGDVKKALSKKQNFVMLRDGSMGLLTEEWMNKYSLMIKMGALNGSNTLRLKKLHLAALENAEEDIEEEAIRSQLAEHKARIQSFDFEAMQNIPVPDNVAAELRPYQKAGMQWMNFLNETGWGGILADDMGLGKTLQTLTFLQHYLNHNPQAFFLIVCPTTLVYNWESEINKFTAGIRYTIHHGPSRSTSIKELQEAGSLVITTYGTLRSDIKMLSSCTFDYVVLDESQAIKNPVSQVARASLLLNSKNRLALSGTPVQNNTFDLFAQMNFLNPGMLGTMEFFRNEFAVPIDKMQEAEARNNLKRLINPFLLRRTKEQVAPDLPEKTETILYCEMGQQQKRIYNAYRNSFRTKILEEIDEKGIGHSRLSVLTGLMKLRQICDSPAIINEEEQFENHSVKINELIRELTENTGNHKALVFSQFLGMLALIRQELEKLNIPYVYFDGGTSTKEREKAIQKFQKDDNCRVFLISLKAGGVGLNLTAADYVYIVDPWWNPTVEQQAIDRTHRIGQTKKIFAYRLICKDTIEEKILLLQHRKLNLAKELIADENAFVKKLSREDIAYLLS